MSDFYGWLKVLHILSVTAWMAGLFYLPRLYVYHADAPAGSPQALTFEVMERRLYRGIMTPAMVSSWLFGLWAGLSGGWLTTVSWLWLKLVFVLAMTVFHFLCERWRLGFVAGTNRHGSRFFRFVNEVPTLLLIAIVVLAVLKPF